MYLTFGLVGFHGMTLYTSWVAHNPTAHTELHTGMRLSSVLQGCVPFGKFVKRFTQTGNAQNLAAHHWAERLCAPRWCAAKLCAGRLGYVEGRRDYMCE